ncbi:MAG: hypothetical protein GDA67_14100 [Nitrospira sp. CR1.3]|nr:hypothetical protein [Nitrospira sp. CR1.3]
MTDRARRLVKWRWNFPLVCYTTDERFSTKEKAMGTQVPPRHPLRQLFGALTEKSFTEHLGWPDQNVTTYVSNLLVDFTRTDQLYKIRTQQGKSADTVVDLLYESEVLLEAQSLDRERDVHQHIGDFTLFMAGLFPEYLRRLKSAGMIYHQDFLVDYVKTGKRSYGIVAQMAESPGPEETPLFRKLSDNFELCVTGLGFVRSDLDRLRDPTYRQAKDLLLN